jgi:hypothetical protein
VCSVRKLEEQKANKISEIQQLGRQNKHLHNEIANLVSSVLAIPHGAVRNRQGHVTSKLGSGSGEIQVVCASMISGLG